LDLRLAATTVLMMGAALVGGFGVLRLAASWTASFHYSPAAL
jgi:hypothetical protein